MMSTEDRGTYMLDPSCHRGVDFRCGTLGRIDLTICSQFDCTRDMIQICGRTGRRGDATQRHTFGSVMIDQSLIDFEIEGDQCGNINRAIE